MKFFRWYQFVGPLIFLPPGYCLWLGRYDGNHALAALALSVPIVFAYVAVYGLVLQRVEALGTDQSPSSYWTLLVVGNVAGIVVPVLAYVASSYRRHGDSALKVGQRPVPEGVLS